MKDSGAKRAFWRFRPVENGTKRMRKPDAEARVKPRRAVHGRARSASGSGLRPRPSRPIVVTRRYRRGKRTQPKNGVFARSGAGDMPREKSDLARMESGRRPNC